MHLPRPFPQGVLRRLTVADLASFQAYRGDPRLGRYQGWSRLSDTAAADFLREASGAPLFVPGEWNQIAIADSTDDRLIGDIGLFLAPDGRHVEIGFTLEVASQGRGIATAAAREAIELVFDATTVERVIGVTDERNAASIRLLARVGMREVATRHTVFRGEPCVERVYELTRADR